MRLVVFGLTIAFVTHAAVAAQKPVRFWNLTSETVTSLRLALVGTRDYGSELTKGDSDGSVDHDERLAIGNLAPGHYDGLIGFKSGRSCMVKGIKIQTSSVFSIEENDLVSCAK
jgi:hypothetical protein